MILIPKLQIRKSKTGESFFFSIPKEYITKMGWKRGDDLVISVLDDTSLKVEKV